MRYWLPVNDLPPPGVFPAAADCPPPPAENPGELPVPLLALTPPEPPIKLLKEDKRWVYGVPPVGNANFAWVQHFIPLRADRLSRIRSSKWFDVVQSVRRGDIRKAIIEADFVDCMVALPGQLFYSTQIPVCLWFLARSKRNGRFRDRKGKTLFINAREMGTLVDRVQRELSDDDVAKIAGIYRAWRGDKNAGTYADVSGFCKVAKLDDIRKHGHVLTPGAM
jgi:type I restriction enzyme M protein